MDKEKTIVHFLTAGVFVFFAFALFKISNGEATTDRFPNPDGSYDYAPVLKLYIPCLLCVAALAGIITVLQDGEFGAWLGSVGVIAGFGLVGCFLNLMSIVCFLIVGVYVIWWAIVAIKTLAYNWYNFEWENFVLIIVRALIAVTLASFVLVWMALPVEFDIVQDMTTVMPICGWAGGLAIATAVGLVIEALLWIRYDSY